MDFTEWSKILNVRRGARPVKREKGNFFYVDWSFNTHGQTLFKAILLSGMFEKQKAAVFRSAVK